MRKIIDFSQIPEADIIVDYIVSRFKKGLGTIIFVIGIPGTGKSSTCARLAELTSIALHEENEITVDNFASSALEFISFVRSSKRLGDICIPDEFQVLFPSRRAMSKDNVAGGAVFDTVRKKQMILICNAPILGSMDSHMRALGNVLVETLRINKSEKVVVSKALRLQTAPRSGKTYLHRFQRKGKEVHRIFTRRSNMKVWEEYEKSKDVFLDRLYKKLLHEAEVNEKKLSKEIDKDVKVRDLTTKELQVHQLINVKKITAEKVASVMGVSVRRIYAIIQNIHKKGDFSKGIEHMNMQNVIESHLN